MQITDRGDDKMSDLKNKVFKIAAASRDGKRVDSHFGMATVYQIISVNMDDGTWKSDRIQEVNFPGTEVAGDTRCWGHNEERVTYVAEKLADCKYLLISKIGPHPQRVLARYNFECLETNMEIDEAVKKIIEFETKQGGK